MIALESDLKVSFEKIHHKFNSMIVEYESDLERIVQNVLNNFDFEKALEEHIHCKIEDGLDCAFNEIDITNSLKSIIWKEIENRITRKDGK